MTIFLKDLIVAAACMVVLGVLDVSADEDLDGVSGKIFRVTPAERSFELLKETVIDPKTDEGKSRHTVYWNDRTVFTRVVRHKSFKDISGRQLVEFYNLNKRWVEEIKAGRMFKDRYVKIPPETDKPHGLSEDGTSIVGWFTPDKSDKRNKQGDLAFNGKTVRASLLGPNGAIDVYSAATAEDIYNGFWETTIEGERVDGRFTISRMKIYPKPDPRETDDPSLPRVLVIGDSISMNYRASAEAALKGVVNYHSPGGNAGASERGALCMELWLGDYEQEGLHWDLIQWNHGLHDLKQYYDEKTDTYGKHTISLDDYKHNLEAEITILRKTGATLMWCSTTPVPNTYYGRWDEGLMGRVKDEDLVFNKAALEVMSKHPDILINDLNAAVRKAVKETDLFDEWSKGKDVHYWGDAQAEIVGKAVAEAIKQALAAET